MHEPKGKSIVWMILYTITGVIDLIQIIITLTGIGVIVSEALEVVTPFIILGLLFIFNIPIINKPLRILSLIGVGLGDSLTGGVAPFWILDIIYLHRSVKAEDAQNAAQQSQQEMLSSNIRRPLYENGLRQPVAQSHVESSKPLNIDGIRPPNGD